MAKTPALNYTIQQSEKILNETLAQYLVDLQEGRLSQSDFDVQNNTLHIKNALAAEQYRRAICLCDGNNFETECDDDLPSKKASVATNFFQTPSRLLRCIFR